jgi:myo-inositol 2-dehydrogenase/D-chiro-inositol 1-dehydrogenase
MSGRAKLAVVGLGRIGVLHAQNLAHRVAGGEVAIVVDSRQEVAESTGERLGVRWSTSLDEALVRSDIDGVVISTPTPAHKDGVIAAAAAGKHVLCEKPLAGTLEATQEALDAVERAGIRLQIGFQLRHDPDFVALASRIHAGELGEISFLHASLRDMTPPSAEYLRCAGGLLVDGAVHLFDLARWLVGEIEEVSVTGRASTHPSFVDIDDVETTVTVVRFANGALGVLENSRACGYGFECRAEVVGSRGTVQVRNHRRTHLEWRTPGAVSHDHVTDFIDRFPDAYLGELEGFVRVVSDDDPPRGTGRDALAAARLTHVAKRSLQLGESVSLNGCLPMPVPSLAEPAAQVESRRA